MIENILILVVIVGLLASIWFMDFWVIKSMSKDEEQDDEDVDA